MRVAHLVTVTPHQCGLYETARDLVAAERKAGLDAQIVDPTKPPAITEDRGVPIAPPEFALTCDVIVSHSGLGSQFAATTQPIIHMLHGRPHSSFILEQQGKIPVYSHLRRISADPRYKAFVTFWHEFVPYWAVILPTERLHAIPAPVDLNLWTPDGPRGYTFHGHKASVNVVCASLWREDETPYHVLNAFHLYATRHPEARLHIYAAPQKGTAWETLKTSLQEKQMLGEVAGMVQGLEHVYRAANAAITPHCIATRSVREALACECNVVMAGGNAPTPFAADPQNLPAYAHQIERATTETTNNRQVAEHLFDPQRSAAKMIEILEEAISGSR